MGSFTALIGDPTGRSKTRPPLTQDEIDRNAETYKTQIFKILDPARTEVRFNSEWLEPLGSAGWVKLAAKYNVAQMMERRDFKTRFEAGQPIGVHEFLYPLAQAYDSVYLVADVELGGTDQLFNLNVGRDIMPAFGLEPQVVMTTPLLEGLDGVEKMSKSLGNYVGVTDSATEMFGKLMSISDDLMWRYYVLLTDLTPEAVLEQTRRGFERGRCIRSRRRRIWRRRSRLTSTGPTQPGRPPTEFERRFAKKELSLDELPALEWTLPDEPKAWRYLLVGLKLATSGGDADRKLAQGAVRLNGRKITDPQGPQQAELSRGESYLLQIGRHAHRLVVR